MAFSSLQQLCKAKNLKMTKQRRIIIRVLSESQDHPDVEDVHARARQLDPKISLATVYRTLRLLEEAHILKCHDFGDGKSRFEEALTHHHHLIDLNTGDVVEFFDERIEALQRKIAKELGYKLIEHRLELFGVPLEQRKET